MKAAKMWVVTMNSGDAFTITADTEAEAKEKALRWRRDDSIKNVKNVVDIITAQKYELP